MKIYHCRIAAGWLCVALFSSTLLSSSARPPITESSKTGVTQTLIDLLNKQDKTNLNSEDYENTSLGILVRLGTPAGYRLKLRYLEFGMSLVEAMKVVRDEDLKRRLMENVQWAREPKVRAEAITTLAMLYDPGHKKLFKEAIFDSKVGIRAAGIEALQVWNQPETIPLLKTAMGRDWSPFMQVYAAQALLSLGEKDAINILWKLLDHNSWVVKAMAARYLGDYGQPDDYTKLVDALNRETKNDFVIAELCLSALKLISRKGEKVSYSAAMPGWKDNEEVAYTVGKGGVIELEPLVIVPPRLRIPTSVRIAQQINTQLLRLIKDRLDVPLDPVQAQDPVLQDLYGLVTPSGFALQTRYSQLSYLVIEALAGTSDPLLRAELEKLCYSDNPLVRASALISLAYSRNPSDLRFIQDGLTAKNATVRFGAMEAVEVGRFKEALPSVVSISMSDPCPAFEVYALQVMAKFGDDGARSNFLSRLFSPDWPTRAMAFWYLGRYGTSDDYTIVLSRLSSEANPFVQAEIALAALRLAPLE